MCILQTFIFQGLNIIPPDRLLKPSKIEIHTNLSAIKSASKFWERILSLLLVGHASAESLLYRNCFSCLNRRNKFRLFALKSISLEPAKLRSGPGFQMSLVEQILNLIYSKMH